MRLKRVRIFGFKTFADKTDLDLDGDLIAIVGPNGCGKSNLVDAILWGLGEGNARQLRAQNSQDVIFNGSSRRKPIGYTEVTLLFDNEDGSLPMSTPEVAVTRKLTRSGQSEYQINRQSCRLRDVLDLLADSGLGRSGYAIVGQKEIDQALAASAEDRRAWVDEAAGVQRYRARKTESLRRLAAAQDHLSRIEDILREIEAQREPLREEAEVARKYKQALSSLREVESGLLIREVAAAVNDILTLDEALDRSMKLVDEESKRADQLEHEVGSLGDQIGALERELDSVRALQQAALTASERAEAAIRLCDQRLVSLDELEASLAEEAEAGEGRVEQAQADVEAATESLDKERSALEGLRAELSGAGEEAEAFRKELKELETGLEAGRASNAERLRLEAEAKHRKQRLKEIVREIQGIDDALPELREAAEDAKTGWTALVDAAKRNESEAQQLREQIQKLNQEEDQAGQQSRRLLAERAALEGKRRGIESTIESHEGLNQGARAVLEAVDRGLLEGRYVPVGEAIEVGKAHAVAIETALGGAANDLIVRDESDAKRAIGYLKANRAGRATFQPIPLMRPTVQTPELRQLLNNKGVVGRASELVDCDPEFRPVVESLLGRVVVVEDLDTALRHARTSGWSRMVTLDGELVHSSGAVTGGTAARQSFGLVQRKAELADAVRQVNALDQTLKTMESASEKRRKDVEKIRLEIATLQKEVADGQPDRDEARHWYDNVAAEMNEAVRSRGKLAREAEGLEAGASDLPEAVDLQALEARRDEAVHRLASRSADAESAAKRLAEAEDRCREAESRLEMAVRRRDSVQEGEQARARRRANIGPERERLKQERQEAVSHRDASKEDKVLADARHETGQTKRRELLERSLALTEEAKSARQNAQSCGDAAHQAELGRARADAKRAASLQRLVEDYGISEDEAVERAPSIELPADVATLVSRLRREIKAMGDVNLGAVEAYERLTQRADELTGQKDDVLGGLEQVKASISELDRMTQDRFASTFEKLEAAFGETFQKLFGGGEGVIRLTDPSNLLETGIEIEATLPGKKRQRLELLSGGERALCAATFLFALLKVKPSPIAILDEVDAPLDGRNVERFIELLKDFHGTTQFILITHNHVTIHSAESWIGVTMQEPGVSSIVPVRLQPSILDSQSEGSN